MLPHTCVCLHQARPVIFIGIWFGLFEFNSLRWEEVFRFDGKVGNVLFKFLYLYIAYTMSSTFYFLICSTKYMYMDWTHGVFYLRCVNCSLIYMFHRHTPPTHGVKDTMFLTFHLLIASYIFTQHISEH